MDASKVYLLAQNGTPPSKEGGLVCMEMGVALILVFAGLGILSIPGDWLKNVQTGKKVTDFAPLAMFPPPVISPGPPGARETGAAAVAAGSAGIAPPAQDRAADIVCEAAGASPSAENALHDRGSTGSRPRLHAKCVVR